MSTERYGTVGKRVPMVGALARTRGSTRFVSDLKFPGMVHAKILRSPYPHANILSIDTTEARSLPGVLSITTAAHTPKIKFSFFAHLADQLPLADKKVCYVGDPVAAVAAVDELTADRALDLIRVEYQTLPAVFDPEEAIKPDAPTIHEQFKNNIAFSAHRAFGNVEQAMKEADFVIENRYVTQKPAHCCLETRTCIAYFDEADNLTVWAHTQCPHTLREEVSRVLGIPQRKVRVIKGETGGAFGSRTVMDMNIPIAAVLSRKTRRHVRIANTRKEEFENAKTRYPYVMELKTGVKKDGRMVARQARILVDNGAYNDKGPATLYFSSHIFGVLYDVPNIKFDADIVVTNKEPGTAFRGFGNTQLAFAAESQLDEIAEALNIDPVELRLINANKSEPHVTVSTAEINSCAVRECIATLAERMKRRRVREQEQGTKRRGRGMGVFCHSGAGTRYYKFNSTDAYVKIGRDGTVFLTTPVADVGQGTRTAMVQIAAEELGVGVDDIVLLLDDTDTIPYDLGAFGSRETVICGNAVRAAAAKAREEIFRFAEGFLDTDAASMTIENGVIRDRQNENISMALPEAIEKIFRSGTTISTIGHFIDTTLPTDENLATGTGPLFPSYSFGAIMVEVEIDITTGQITVMRVVGAYDIGQLINPTLVEGQIEGAVVQGLGFALTEDLIEEKGSIINPDFMDYKIFTAADIPHMESLFIERDDPFGPYGAKGIGEPGLVPMAPAVANAVYDAIGVRIRDLPITPEKVCQALKKTQPN